MLQEAENFLRRQLLHCYCPELEAELILLQEELEVLQISYNNYQRTTNITQRAFSRGMRNLIRCCTDLRNSLHNERVFITTFYNFLFY